MQEVYCGTNITNLHQVAAPTFLTGLINNVDQWPREERYYKILRRYYIK